MSVGPNTANIAHRHAVRARPAPGSHHDDSPHNTKPLHSAAISSRIASIFMLSASPGVSDNPEIERITNSQGGASAIGTSSIRCELLCASTPH